MSALKDIGIFDEVHAVACIQRLERELAEARSALVCAHDTMLMVKTGDLGRTDREALDAARERARVVLRA